MSKNRLARALTLWVTAALLWAGPSFADHDTIPSEGLEQLKSLSDSTVTVSGISSGAFFAHQFHVAHSDLVKGAGIVAGGPYACAEQIEGISPPLNPFNPFLPNPIIGIIPKRIVTAFAVCTRFDEGAFRNTGWTHPANPAPKESEKIARQAEAARKISKLSNLADSRVWVFASQDDKLVPLSTVEALKGFYEEMGLVAGQGLKIEPKPDAAHGMPIKVLPVEGPHCSQPDPAFLIKCDYGAAELLLRHLYDGSFASSSTNRTPGRLVRFDQRPFFDQTTIGSAWLTMDSCTFQRVATMAQVSKPNADFM